ncbi:MAG TPA: hypothetical protein VM915_09685 [Verrucomicrobiae bacterium]|nr:hypothetical protein [Verrucomicrobiae bacterium]
MHLALLWWCFYAAEWGGLLGVAGAIAGGVIGYHEPRAIRKNKRVGAAWGGAVVGTVLGMFAGAAIFSAFQP